MKTVLFTVYDPVTQEVLRSGYCSENDAQKQAALGQAVLIGVRANDIEDKIVVPSKGGTPGVTKRSAAEIETRTPKNVPTIDQVEVLIEALRKKGVAITKADLQAAATDLKGSKAGSKGS